MGELLLSTIVVSLTWPATLRREWSEADADGRLILAIAFLAFDSALVSAVHAIRQLFAMH